MDWKYEALFLAWSHQSHVHGKLLPANFANIIDQIDNVGEAND